MSGSWTSVAPGDASPESWERVVSVNLTSMFSDCKYVLPVMEAQGGGIVNIASMPETVTWGSLCVLLRHQGRRLQLTQSVALDMPRGGSGSIRSCRAR
ncbi:MAG: hypothetical protein Ct9H300mP1_10970 [Planctomycetaceae bacterium]|nr:MAG: hypothetical protein Ct9H300mP1_10970 [Planctomycetaceae bacterium]